MDRLITEKRVQVVSALAEGSRIDSIVRMTGVAKHTVVKLLEDVGCACAAYHHRHVRGMRVRLLQCDGIWAFVGAKAKNVSVEKKAEGWGDARTWSAIEAVTKVCVSYLAGGRDTGWATDFMLDCAHRIIGHPQITLGARRARTR